MISDPRQHHVWCNGSQQAPVAGCRWCDGPRGLLALYPLRDGDTDDDLSARHFPNAVSMRHPDEDDGRTYGDPRDEMAERLDRD